MINQQCYMKNCEMNFSQAKTRLYIKKSRTPYLKKISSIKVHRFNIHPLRIIFKTVDQIDKIYQPVPFLFFEEQHVTVRSLSFLERFFVVRSLLLFFVLAQSQTQLKSARRADEKKTI